MVCQEHDKFIFIAVLRDNFQTVWQSEKVIYILGQMFSKYFSGESYQSMDLLVLKWQTYFDGDMPGGLNTFI